MASGSPEPDPVLLEQGLALVDLLARKIARVSGAGFVFEDLQGYGREGLLDALQRFDATRGVPFRAYASFRIRGAIYDGLRALAHLPRRTHDHLRALEAARLTSEGASEDVFGAPTPPGTTRADAERGLSEHLAGMATAMALGLIATPARPGSEELVGEEGRTASPEEAVAERQFAEQLRREVAALPQPEEELIRRHYLEGERFDHIAAELGLSKSWASRLHTRGLRRLAERLRGAGEQRPSRTPYVRA